MNTKVHESMFLEVIFLWFRIIVGTAYGGLPFAVSAETRGSIA
jgi:hypothetical protein